MEKETKDKGMSIYGSNEVRKYLNNEIQLFSNAILLAEFAKQYPSKYFESMDDLLMMVESGR